MALFSKNDNLTVDMQSISTLISEGCILDGNLNARAYARIDGQIIGDVMIDGGLILGEKGSIEGNIITKEMVLYGTVTGNVNVKSLEIKASGRMNGEIKTQILTIENGAVYNGSLSMGEISEPAHVPEPDFNKNGVEAVN